ncbi:MAG: nucleoside-triphosphatase, partial [Candidatus Thorarchaeota archaeon]
MPSPHPEFKSEFDERQNRLLTGRPGIGKTTLIRAIVEKLGPSKAERFWSKEIREGGRRVGFYIETLSGK